MTNLWIQIMKHFTPIPARLCGADTALTKLISLENSHIQNSQLFFPQLKHVTKER